MFTTKTFTYQRLNYLLGALRGDPQEKDGLAFRPLPLGSVLLPLRRFVKDATAALQDGIEVLNETTKEIEETEGLTEAEQTEQIDTAYEDFLRTRVEIRVTQIPLEAIEAREDLSLADLEVLEPFLPNDDNDESTDA